MQVMLPYVPNVPSQFAQPAASTVVSVPVTGNLLLPPPVAVPFEVVALSAPVPKTTVNENDDSDTRKHNVWVADKRPPIAVSIAITGQVPMPSSPKGRRKFPLGLSTSAIALHRPAALVWSHYIVTS